jgi:hypothetical protein
MANIEQLYGHIKDLTKTNVDNILEDLISYGTPKTVKVWNPPTNAEILRCEVYNPSTDSYSFVEIEGEIVEEGNTRYALYTGVTDNTYRYGVEMITVDGNHTVFYDNEVPSGYVLVEEGEQIHKPHDVTLLIRANQGFNITDATVVLDGTITKTTDSNAEVTFNNVSQGTHNIYAYNNYYEYQGTINITFNNYYTTYVDFKSTINYIKFKFTQYGVPSFDATITCNDETKDYISSAVDMEGYLYFFDVNKGETYTYSYVNESQCKNVEGTVTVPSNGRATVERTIQ